MFKENSDRDDMDLKFIAESERVKGLKACYPRKLQKLTRKGHRFLATPALLEIDESQSRSIAYKGSLYWSKGLENVMNNHPPRLKVLADNSCQQLKIYLPATSKKEIRYVQKGQKLLTILVGGATSYQVVGTYKNKSGVIEDEQIACVWAWVAASMIAEVLEKVKIFAGRVILELSQECVLLEINGSPYMVEKIGNRLCLTPLSDYQSRRRNDLAA